MAELVDSLPAAGRRSGYPWHEWLDGRVWRLERGVDFEGTMQGMRSTVRQAGRRMGVLVKTRVERDHDKPGKPERWLYVQAFPRDEGRSRAR